MRETIDSVRCQSVGPTLREHFLANAGATDARAPRSGQSRGNLLRRRKRQASTLTLARFCFIQISPAAGKLKTNKSRSRVIWRRYAVAVRLLQVENILHHEVLKLRNLISNSAFVSSPVISLWLNPHYLVTVCWSSKMITHRRFLYKSRKKWRFA